MLKFIIQERKKKMKKTVKCPECKGEGQQQWGDYFDVEECPVCEGHGEWLEEEDEVDQDELLSIYPEITDEEINIMYEDFFYGDVGEAIKEYEKNDKNYRIS